MIRIKYIAIDVDKKFNADLMPKGVISEPQVGDKIRNSMNDLFRIQDRIHSRDDKGPFLELVIVPTSLVNAI